MLVTVTGFGSVWRRGYGQQQSASKRCARPAYFNTTGVPVNGAIRTWPRIEGHVCFNGMVGFDPYHPLAMLNSVFDCADPCVWQGQNKVLFRRMLRAPQQPDFVLTAIRASEIGHLDVNSPACRSEGTLLISLSEWRDQQEAMLLMPLESWLRTEVGKFVLRPFVCWPWSARLQREPF
jgi:hypothetical protein